MVVFAGNNFGDTRSGGLAGPMGLFVIVLLCIATVLLIRNMNRRLRRLPDSFTVRQPTQREAEIALTEAGTAAPGATTDRPDARPAAPGGGAATVEHEVTGVVADGDGPATAAGPGRV